MLLNISIVRIKKYIKAFRNTAVGRALYYAQPYKIMFIEEALLLYFNDPKHSYVKRIVQKTHYYCGGTYALLALKLRNAI